MVVMKNPRKIGRNAAMQRGRYAKVSICTSIFPVIADFGMHLLYRTHMPAFVHLKKKINKRPSGTRALYIAFPR